jgi:hypothetical protein
MIFNIIFIQIPTRLARYPTKYYDYCSANHCKNFSILTDSITIGIELCKIPHISEHCEISLRLFNVMGKFVFLYP